MVDAKFEYKLSAVMYFVIAFVLIGFAIVALVQGIKMQFSDETASALAFYLAPPLLIFVSYLTYHKAHYKLRVLAMART